MNADLAQLALQQLLQNRFSEHRQKNPRYSIRAYSKRVGVHFAALSSILNGKRRVSRKLASRIAERLYLDPQERSELLTLFPPKRSTALKSPKGSEQGSQTVGKYVLLDAQQFKIASEWEYFAVLSLLQCRNFKSEKDWIAKRLKITSERVRKVIDRLIELKLLTLSKSGRLERSTQDYRTPDELASVALKKSHEQTLELARDSLFRDPVEGRDFTSVTVAVNPKNLSTAKEMIRKFQDDLCDLLEAGDRTEVYRLSVQLFPLTDITGDQS